MYYNRQSGSQILGLHPVAGALQGRLLSYLVVSLVKSPNGAAHDSGGTAEKLEVTDDQQSVRCMRGHGGTYLARQRAQRPDLPDKATAFAEGKKGLQENAGHYS